MKLSLLLPLFAGIAVAARAAGAPEKGYTNPSRLAELVANKREPYILVDVRTPAEYESGHIPTAVNIPNTEIRAKPPSTDKAALIIVYCRSGNRSAMAKKDLETLGFSRVVDFGAVSKCEGTLVPGTAPGK